MTTVSNEELCNLIVSFDGLLTRKEVFLGSSYWIQIHLDVVVEVLDIQRSVSFEFCLYEELIEFW